LETFSSYKNLILKNILWGNLNTIVRYILAFLATAVLARKFPPEDFGTYQLVISYLATFEAFYLVNPTHLRNYLAAFPEEEKMVASLWRWQSFILFFLTCLICIGMVSFSQERQFWFLVLLASLKLLFRFNDYVSIICEQRFMNYLAQQVTLFHNFTFNLLRIVLPFLSQNLSSVCLASPVQGIVSSYQQMLIAKKHSIHPASEVDIKKFFAVFRSGFVLTALSFLGVFQARIVSLMLAEYLPKETFGNLQLVLKLVEPATMLGLVIISANYSVLANSLRESFVVFNKRFAKISFLALLVSGLMMIFIIFTPTSWLVRFFGEDYLEGISLLGEGSVLVLSNAFFVIDQNYDFLRREYKFALGKYILILLLYSLLIWIYRGEMSLTISLRICIYIPLSISVLSLSGRVVEKILQQRSI
jgi:O-antigen/teichoic acid export membrane protein